MLHLFATLISLTTLFGYINHRWLKMPTTIGVMLISVVIGIILKIVEFSEPRLIDPMRQFLTSFDFTKFVLNFVLCFLLFAGSLHVNSRRLRSASASVLSYATIGVIISTFVVGTITWLLLSLLRIDLPYSSCLVFGALISPTDPIAVVGVLSQYDMPRKLKTEIVGESLFNDGVGVVVFSLLIAFATGESKLTPMHITEVFCVEVLGGLGIGFLIGQLGYFMIKSIDHYQTEVMITLAIVTGGYSLADAIHASGPLAMVVAGLLIGNKGKHLAMSDLSAEYLDKFWELIDEICNTILFVLMGLEIFLLPYDLFYILIGVMLIGVALIGRLISVIPAFYLFNRGESRKTLNLAVLTWGGLRGGVSIALALSLPGQIRGGSLFIVATYCIVLFSILVQGLTMKKLLERY